MILNRLKKDSRKVEVIKQNVSLLLYLRVWILIYRLNLLFCLFEMHPLVGTTYGLQGRVVNIIKIYADISSFIKDVKQQGV